VRSSPARSTGSRPASRRSGAKKGRRSKKD
jgi:hypothetical protein